MENKFKQVGLARELPLTEELYEMFKIGFHKGIGMNNNHIPKILLAIGNMAITYGRMLDNVNDKAITNISSKIQEKYLYDINFEMGNILINCIGLSINQKLNNADIHNGFVNLCENFEMPELIYKDHEIRTLVDFSRSMNIRLHHIYNNPDISLRPIVSITKDDSFSKPSNDLFFTGGKVIDDSFLPVLNKMAMNIVMVCSLLTESLEAGESADKKVTEERIINLWVTVFSLYDLMGHSWDSIQRLFSVTINFKEDKDGE